MKNINQKLIENIVLSAKLPIIPTSDRLIEDHQTLLEIVKALREMGLTIVYTMGTWDLFHIGHSRYFIKGESYGDVVIGGIDADEYIKQYKGPDRPVVPYFERWETVAGQRAVDLVTILRTQTANDELVQLIRPDVVLLSFSSTKDDLKGYEDRMQKKYGQYCGKVEILPRQAETSTSAKIRLVIIDGAKPLMDFVKEHTDALVKKFEDFFKKIEEK